MKIFNAQSLTQTILATLVLLLLASCSSKQEPREYKFDEAFAPYISAYTTGKISRQSTIKVRLNENVAQTAQIGVTLTENPFEFDPEVEGTAVWIDERTIQFEPKEPMPTDQYYKGEFKLGEYIKDL